MLIDTILGIWFLYKQKKYDENIVCEKKSDEQWYITDEKFLEEEKRITLKILEIAQELSITQTS